MADYDSILPFLLVYLSTNKKHHKTLKAFKISAYTVAMALNHYKKNDFGGSKAADVALLTQFRPLLKVMFKETTASEKLILAMSYNNRVLKKKPPNKIEDAIVFGLFDQILSRLGEQKEKVPIPEKESNGGLYLVIIIVIFVIGSILSES